jgi:hypothetical protein
MTPWESAVYSMYQYRYSSRPSAVMILKAISLHLEGNMNMNEKLLIH